MLGAETLSAHVERIAAEGYTIVEDAFPESFADQLAEVLANLEGELGAKPSANAFEGAKTVRIYNLLAHHPIFQQVAEHENVLPVVEQVLDRGCLISSLSSIGIDPGERSQPIHADDQLIPLPKPHPPLVCNSMWAITDFTAENGATRVIPGSHLRDHSPTFGQEYDSEPAVMRRGSVMIYNGSMWHGGGANHSPRRRVGIAMNYCAGYIRQQENQQLGLPRATARDFSSRLREMVGYGVYNGLIGHIDKRNPVALLDLQQGQSGVIWDKLG